MSNVLTAVINQPKMFVKRKNVKTPKELEANSDLKTMYQYQFNDTANARFNSVDTRSITERNEYFKRSQKLQNDLLNDRKKEIKYPPRKYRSDKNQRISEYMAEISYIGGKIMSSRLHHHAKCGQPPRMKCEHYVKFN